MIQSKLNACNPVRPVPIMEIHGTADNVVPYNGSLLNTFVAIPTLMAAWVDFNNCNPTPTVTPVPNINTTDGCTAEHYLYSGGENGSTVEHYKIIGGGHTWPGAIFNIGVTNQDFSASREIWRFFSQYRLDELTAAGETVAEPVPLSRIAAITYTNAAAGDLIRKLREGLRAAGRRDLAREVAPRGWGRSTGGARRPAGRAVCHRECSWERYPPLG